ncbi:hypothetical protein E2C01_021694 [Portunus trituberculatus]|uniref:Uncharacterized protein n=1 Tax=Portunus trituberculatus TaxID=210409 RepID=A0A5B7E421_PORTR|nr:hypothetical protein [Portunus trituberculatus]
MNTDRHSPFALAGVVAITRICSTPLHPLAVIPGKECVQQGGKTMLCHTAKCEQQLVKGGILATLETLGQAAFLMTVMDSNNYDARRNNAITVNSANSVRITNSPGRRSVSMWTVAGNCARSFFYTHTSQHPSTDSLHSSHLSDSPWLAERDRSMVGSVATSSVSAGVVSFSSSLGISSSSSWPASRPSPGPRSPTSSPSVKERCMMR